MQLWRASLCLPTLIDSTFMGDSHTHDPGWQAGRGRRIFLCEEEVTCGKAPSSGERGIKSLEWWDFSLSLPLTLSLSLSFSILTTSWQTELDICDSQCATEAPSAFGVAHVTRKNSLVACARRSLDCGQETGGKKRAGGKVLSFLAKCCCIAWEGNCPVQLAHLVQRGRALRF